MTNPDEKNQQGLPGGAGRDGGTVTRSEEELRIYTRRRATQRARLVKYVETETRIIQVRHEHVRVEFGPAVDGDDEQDPPAPMPTTPVGEERWLVLYDEEVSVQTRWVPRERVRMGINTVIEDWEISEDLRSERIDTDDTTHGG